MHDSKHTEARIEELEAENARLAARLAQATTSAARAAPDRPGQTHGSSRDRPSVAPGLPSPSGAPAQPVAEASHGRYALILQNAVDFAIVATDAEGRVTDWNEGARRIFGWTEAEMRGEHARRFFVPDDRQAAVPEREMQLAVQNGRAVDERWHVRKDGTWFWASGEMMPIRGAAGDHQGFVKILRDRTEQHTAEQSLRESQARLELVFGAAGLVGTWDLDVPNGIIYANARFAELFSVPPELGEAGAPVAAYLSSVHPDDLPAVRSAIAATLRTGAAYDIEYRLVQRTGGSRWVLARGSRTAVAADGTALRFCGVVVDITDRKRIEARQAALVELGDRLRDLDSTSEMAFAAAELLGRTLGVSRAGYGSLDPKQEAVEIERDWTTEGVASIAGLHRFADYGSFIDDLKRGEIVAIADVEGAPQTAAEAARLLALDIRALLNVPVMEHGRMVAVFFLHDAERRVWSSDKLRFVHSVADRTRAAIERKRAEQHQTLLMNELQHRVKNTLSMVQAIASQTFRDKTSPEAREAFTARLVALSNANDIITRAGWSAAPVYDVVRGATIPHCAGPERFTMTGPAIEIAARAALSLTLALHELCTNASKYGALSNEAGHVVIDWSIVDEATFRLRWAERGGPAVSQPTRAGFGTRLIERTLGPQLGGKVRTDFDPGGITCTFQVPLATVQDQPGTDGNAAGVPG